jgi:hypothetical protein
VTRNVIRDRQVVSTDQDIKKESLDHCIYVPDFKALSIISEQILQISPHFSKEI